MADIEVQGGGAPTQVGAHTQTQTAGSQTSGAPPASNWTTGFNEDLRGYVEQKGFKDAASVADAYRNFEKLQGVPKERLLQLPDSFDSPEMAAVWERLGAPKEAKDYTFDVPKEHGDEKLADWAREQFHKLRMPRGMAESFIKAWNERQGASVKAQTENLTQLAQNEKMALTKEWGQAYEQNENIANQVARRFEMSPDELKALGGTLGPAKAMKLLHRIGEGLGESPFLNGSNSSGERARTPEGAQSEIKGLMKDSDFSRRLQAGEQDAVQRWNRLHEQAFPGTMSLN